MTLTIAWRSEGRIHLASDSRIQLGKEMYSDVGIKVLALPVLITDTIGAGDGVSVRFRSTYGFAYAGSFVNAGTFAELIGELLQHIQYVGADTPLSFITLCEFLVDYCKRIDAEVSAYLAHNGKYTFVFTGLCPQEKRFRAAQFDFEHRNGLATVTFDEILPNEGDYVLLGSGAAAAKSKIFEVTTEKMLLALNEVIDSGAVPSVGGDIQYGSFKSTRDFSIYGLIRVSTETLNHDGNTYGPETIRIYRYRGFTIYDGWDPLKRPLWITPNLLELTVPSNESSAAFFKKRKGVIDADLI